MKKLCFSKYLVLSTIINSEPKFWFSFNITYKYNNVDSKTVGPYFMLTVNYS